MQTPQRRILESLFTNHAPSFEASAATLHTPPSLTHSPSTSSEYTDTEKPLYTCPLTPDEQSDVPFSVPATPSKAPLVAVLKLQTWRDPEPLENSDDSKVCKIFGRTIVKIESPCDTKPGWLFRDLPREPQISEAGTAFQVTESVRLSTVSCPRNIIAARYQVSTSPITFGTLPYNSRPKQIARHQIPDTWLAEILPLDTLTRITDRGKQCVIDTTLKRTFPRCLNPLKSTMTATSFRDKILEVMNELQILNKLALLEVLIGALSCRSGTHRQRALKHLEAIRNIFTALQADVESRYCSIATATITSWLQALCAVPEEPLKATPQPSLLASIETQTHRLKADNQEQHPREVLKRVTTTTQILSATQPLIVSKNTTISMTYAPGVPLVVGLNQNFIKLFNNPRISVSKLIQETLEKPLGKLDQKSGFVYIYYQPGSFGNIKIGFTADTVKKRLKQWSTGNCSHKIAECDHQGYTCEYVPHVYRLERLVFAELRDYRLKELNCKCQKKHIEWLSVSSVHAAKVRQKYQDFLLEQPRYDTGVGGRLRRDSLTQQEFEALCEPLHLPQVPPVSRQKPTRTSPAQRRSQRLSRQSMHRAASV